MEGLTLDLDGSTLVAGKLAADSTLTFKKPVQPFYVLFEIGPGLQVEQDEITAPHGCQAGCRAGYVGLEAESVTLHLANARLMAFLEIGQLNLMPIAAPKATIMMDCEREPEIHQSHRAVDERQRPRKTYGLFDCLGDSVDTFGGFISCKFSGKENPILVTPSTEFYCQNIMIF